MKLLYLQVEAQSPITIRADHAPEGSATLQYIPGTTLLGSLAAAHHMLRPKMDEEFARFFLKDMIYVPYLYPALFEPKTFRGNRPVMPLPKTAQSCKRFSGFHVVPGERASEERHGIRDSLLDWAVFSLLYKQQKDIKTIIKPVEDHKYCKFSGCQQIMDHETGYYRCGRPSTNPDGTPAHPERMKATVHTRLQTRTGINRDWGVVEENILYNREVFDEDMRFWGAIVFPNEPDGAEKPNDPDNLFNMFRTFLEEAEEEKVIRIGTGRSRGLGHISIKAFPMNGDGDLASFEKKLRDFNEALRDRAKEAGMSTLKPFYFAITLHSPAILCDAFLRYRTTLDPETLAGFLGQPKDSRGEPITFEKIYQATATKRITGWNGLWGTPRTNEHALEMGSTFLFGCSHELDDKLLQALYMLEQTGLGRRRSEGFGRICISDPFHLVGEQV